MCKFFSLVQVFRNGGIDTYYSETVDSHSAICAEHGLDENAMLSNSVMAKIELVPHDKSNYADINEYDFKFDMDTVPGWCAEMRNVMETQAYSALRTVLRSYMSIERCVALNVPYNGEKTSVGGCLDCSGYAHPLPALTSVGGYLDCSGYAHPLPALTSVGGNLYCRGYAHPLPALTSVGGYLDCRGYAHPLPALTSVGGYLDCRGYAHPLPALTTVGRDIYCGGYAHPLRKLTTVGGKLYCMGYAHPLPQKK